MNRERFDAVIVGAGPAGLSLAARLATTPDWRDRSVLLVDDGGARAAECWASWTARPGLLDEAACRTYRQVAVEIDGTARRIPLGRYSYRLVRRADLRRVVSARLAGRAGHRFRDGHVTGIVPGPDAAYLMIDGDPVEASWIFDSRPGGGGGAPDARLAFTGWEVACARPRFDPETPVLMDFRTAQIGGACFVYVLPVSAHRALVEFTAFVPRGGDPPSAAQTGAALTRYLAEVVGAPDHEILRTEGAVLPLSTAPQPRRDGRVLAIGARGGLVKASTGYAYERIQRDSEAIVASLARHGHPFDLPRPHRRHRLLDAVLLDVLARDPGAVRRAFGRLFAANPAERVLRFLDEDTSVADEIRLVATLSPGPFVRAVAGRLPHRPVRPRRPAMDGSERLVTGGSERLVTGGSERLVTGGSEARGSGRPAAGQSRDSWIELDDRRPEGPSVTKAPGPNGPAGVPLE